MCGAKRGIQHLPVVLWGKLGSPWINSASCLSEYGTLSVWSGAAQNCSVHVCTLLPSAGETLSGLKVGRLSFSPTVECFGVFRFTNGKLTSLVLLVLIFVLSQNWTQTKPDVVQWQNAGKVQLDSILAALAETRDEAFRHGWTGQSSRWTLAGCRVWGRRRRSLTLLECRSLGHWSQTRWKSAWIETSSSWAPAGTPRRRFLKRWSHLKSDWILLQVGSSIEARALREKISASSSASVSLCLQKARDVWFLFWASKPEPASEESCSRLAVTPPLFSCCSTTIMEARLKGLSLGWRQE